MNICTVNYGELVLFRCVELSKSCDAVPLTITQTFHYNVLIMPKTFLCVKPNSNGLFQVEREAIIATIRLHFSFWFCQSGMICLPCLTCHSFKYLLPAYLLMITNRELGMMSNGKQSSS